MSFAADTPLRLHRSTGALVTLPSPAVSEMLSDAGFDWLIYDMEHSPLSVSDVQAHLQAKGKSCGALVRVPANDPTWIKRVLDLGCDGIVVPQVNSAEEARAAVAASLYPPMGMRGAGVARAQGYGAHLQEYIASANARIKVIIQIEHRDAVAVMDFILAVEGISGVLIGPYDLSGSYHRLGEVDAPEVTGAIAAVIAACNRAHIPVGIFTLSAEKARAYRTQGCDFIAVAIDAVLLWQKAKEALAGVQ